MSVQTGQVVPDAPASRRLADRARFRFELLLKNPNPIWMRELRQDTRLARTPFILGGITILVTFLIASITGAFNDQAPSDKVGSVLFQTFFSLGFFGVTMGGPALAANSIASEREGRTWEAVILTGMTPQEVARGKFLAAYTKVCTYIVMLAPVGAMTFLYGGVHWLEVAIAFFYLFVLAFMSVAFGLAVSSRMANGRAAILVTLIAAVPLSGILYGVGGLGMSEAAHSLWERVPREQPVWLPLAYVRGDLGLSYLLLLFVAPAIVIMLPGWALYEATVANLTEPNDDRSTGLKRWYIVAVAVLVLSAVGSMIPSSLGPSVVEVMVVELGFYFTFLMLCATVFVSDPLGCSRRITARWERQKTSALRRFLGPGLANTALLQLVVGLSGFAILFGMGALRALGAPMLPPGRLEAALRFALYGVGFFVFSAGFGVFLRARSNNVAAARIVFIVTLIGIAIVPFLGAALLGAFFREEALLIAAPSPFFAFVTLRPVPSDGVVVAGLLASIGWLVAGVLLFLRGRARIREIVLAFEERMQQAEAVFAAEDAALEAAGTAEVVAASEGAASDA